MTRAIHIVLRIENLYDDGTEIVTEPAATVPAPPDRTDSEAWDAWAHEHIYSLTGTGRQAGDSWYDVTVTDCSDPSLIGAEFKYGY